MSAFSIPGWWIFATLDNGATTVLFYDMTSSDDKVSFTSACQAAKLARLKNEGKPVVHLWGERWAYVWYYELERWVFQMAEYQHLDPKTC